VFVKETLYGLRGKPARQTVVNLVFLQCEQGQVNPTLLHDQSRLALAEAVAVPPGFKPLDYCRSFGAALFSSQSFRRRYARQHPLVGCHDALLGWSIAD
jgi:hypothetical protein